MAEVSLAGESWPRGRARHGGIDAVPVPGSSGTLWLCGKHYIAPDPSGAMAAVGAGRVVCLCERHELADRYPGYVEWLGSSADAIWFPIADLHAPAPTALLDLLAELRRLLGEGTSVIVHCGAGIGRAGTVAAALLMTLGIGRQEALGTVAAHRPMAGPEAGAQAELLDALERRGNDRAGGRG